MKIFGVTLLAVLALNAFPLTNYTQPRNTTPFQGDTTQINWMTWEEAMQLSESEPRKILLDVYTEWCYWCKRMDESTFRDTSIAGYINENFYPVKFDAEQKQDIEFKGKVYKYMKSGKKGFHELAAVLLNGRLSFPTLVFLDHEHNVIQSIVGYKTPVQFEKIATYFAEDHFKKTPWSTFKKNYKPILVSE